MHVGAEVVDPQLLGPRFFLSRFVLEEQHVGFDALGVEDAGGQSQQRVAVALLQQVRAYGLSGSAFEQDVVGDDDRAAAIDFQQGLDVLDEVELFVLRAGPEVLPFVAGAFFLQIAVFGDDRDTALFSERKGWRGSG